MQRFFLSVDKIIKENQPVAEVGALRHVFIWMASPWGQKLFTNPRYQPIQNKTTIYCIHGMADRPNAFALVAERLVNDLPEEMTGIRLASFDERGLGISIEAFAKQLKDQILLNQDHDVILLGHSRGGLIAAYFTEYLSRENNINVRAVVSICSPFTGSDKARLPLTWLSDSVNEMQAKSMFLDNLAMKMQTSSCLYYYFAAARDAIVNPESCVIDAQRNKLITLNRHGHLSILSSHRLVEMLRDLIKVTHAHSYCRR